MSTLSEVYMGLGSFRRADDLIRRSLSLPVRDQETRARQMATLAGSRALQGDYEHAASIYGTISKSIGDPEKLNDPMLYSRALIGRGEALAKLNRYGDARTVIRQALTWDSAQSGPRSVSVARDLEALAWTNQMDGQYPISDRDYRTALQIRVEAQGRLHPKVSDDLNQLGLNAYFQDKPDTAAHYWRQKSRAR